MGLHRVFGSIDKFLFFGSLQEGSMSPQPVSGTVLLPGSTPNKCASPEQNHDKSRMPVLKLFYYY